MFKCHYSFFMCIMTLYSSNTKHFPIHNYYILNSTKISILNLISKFVSFGTQFNESTFAL